MRRHLWYLSEDLIGFALFSDCVWNSEKEAMIAALKRPPMKTNVRRVHLKSVEELQAKTLSEFVTERSMNLFMALEIDPDFLAVDHATWPSCSAYVNAKQKVVSMKAINDCGTCC